MEKFNMENTLVNNLKDIDRFVVERYPKGKVRRGQADGKFVIDILSETGEPQITYEGKIEGTDITDVQVTPHGKENALFSVELGERLQCKVMIEGRIVEDFTPKFKPPKNVESISPKLQSTKPKLDPKNIRSDERFLQIMEFVKTKIEGEIPILQNDLVTKLGEGESDEVVAKLKKAIEISSRTSSILAIKFVMEALNAVVINTESEKDV